MRAIKGVRPGSEGGSEMDDTENWSWRARWIFEGEADVGRGGRVGEKVEARRDLKEEVGGRLKRGKLRTKEIEDPREEESWVYC